MALVIKHEKKHLKDMWDNPNKYPIVKSFESFEKFFMWCQRARDLQITIELSLERAKRLS